MAQVMWLQAHTPRWGTWRTGAAKAQKGKDALADSAPPQAPRPHATRKGSSRPGPRPAHLQPLRIHGFHRAGSQASWRSAGRSPAEEPGAHGPAAQAQIPLALPDAAGGAGWGGAALPLAAGGRGRALNAGICAEEVLRGRRRCEDPEEGLRVGKGERPDGAEGEGVSDVGTALGRQRVGGPEYLE